MLDAPFISKTAPRYADFQTICDWGVYNTNWHLLSEGHYSAQLTEVGKNNYHEFTTSELAEICPDLVNLFMYAFTKVPGELKLFKYTDAEQMVVRAKYIHQTWHCWMSNTPFFRQATCKEKIYLDSINNLSFFKDTEQKIKVSGTHHCVKDVTLENGQKLKVGSIQRDALVYTYAQLDDVVPGFMKKYLLAKELGLTEKQSIDAAMAIEEGTRGNNVSNAFSRLPQLDQIGFD